MSNPEFKPVPQGRDAMTEVAASRSAQEVQAKMVIAKRFPRDYNESFTRIMKSCKRRSLAEGAIYAYPRGGTTVTGPSIRLAEVLAQAWGNIAFGIIEVEQRKGASTMCAYAWDLETNTYQERVFEVKHTRFTRKGIKTLDDPRDIYEMTANQGARRLRACILGVMPGDVVEDAVKACEGTLASGHSEPREKRIAKMVAAFNEMGVTQAMLERRLGHDLESTIEAEIVQYHAIYTSLKNNASSVDDFFDRDPAKPAGMDLSGVDEGSRADRPHRKTSDHAGDEPPEKPRQGQGWLDTSDPENHVLRVYDEGEWKPALAKGKAKPAQGGQKAPSKAPKKKATRKTTKKKKAAKPADPPPTDDDLGLDGPPAEETEPFQSDPSEPNAGGPSHRIDPVEEAGAAVAETEDENPPDFTPLPNIWLGKLHMAFRKCGVDDATRRAYLVAAYQVDTLKMLNEEQAQGLMENLDYAIEHGDITWIEDTIKAMDSVEPSE